MSTRSASIAVAVIAAIAGHAAADASARGVLVLQGGRMNGAVAIHGNGLVETSTLTVNSMSPRAVIGQGNGSLKVDTLSIVGGMETGGNFACETPVTAMSLPAIDPHSLHVFPLAEGPGDDARVEDDATLSPGTYRNIRVNSHATLTLEPGVYHITDGLDISGHASIVGEGVTLIIHGGELSASGHGTLRLTPPVDGDTAGFAIVQPASNDGDMSLTGGAALRIEGTIYAPAAEISIHGGADAEASTPLFGEGIICGSLAVTTGRRVLLGMPAEAARPLRTFTPPRITGLAD